jgi:sterol desaturase/sphingolipid hydroxylase (fatty acid hydroxylase superfamily)
LVTILLVIFGSLAIVGLWEFFQPRRRREFPALKRRLANIGVWIANLVLVSLLLPKSAPWGPPQLMPGTGLVPWPATSAALSLLAGFLILDCMHYWVHRAEHAVPLLWRFHALHHTDPDVDVTTSVRHHPIEYVAASFVYWTADVLLWIPASVVLVHALTVFAAASLQHGNIRLPGRVERLLQPLFNTLDLHRLHHSVKPAEANANYGAVFSVWDRAFGTLLRVGVAEHQQLVFGVGKVPRREGLSPTAMLLTPWRLDRVPALRGRRSSGRRAMIASPKKPRRRVGGVVVRSPKT